MSSSTITPEQLQERLKSKPELDLIDVRTPAEFQELHLKSARNIPLDKLDPNAIVKERNGSAEEPVYMICRSGSRGEMACQKFQKAGHSNAVNVVGGTMACDEAGLQVVRGRKVMSLERQVRIAAGSLVVIGTALGAFVHPGFLGIAAFVGAGLVFAGITDTCGMGMMLARMPWNQCSENSGSCKV
ncbi:rhodanese-like domain-containing protein [Rubinisphaera italica]|uniref:Inner membrane protein YgaP n=1 Tax=Rubinisphaera italica TaxID=2527969 RepID=A0A5C5XKB6_9PLAN|nr:rhodanese-like domain-containing protein [Rubinisphaera italica]TWT62979.1 Inner membrane protein YgaP [Rubinisphaera italica]